MEHAFGSDFTVGIEEELLLVDSESRELAPVAADVLPRIDAADGTASFEAYAAQLELRSPPSVGAGEARAALAHARSAAREAGATLMGAGLHPAAPLGEVELVAEERYRKVGEEMRGLIRRTPEGALHVHVGVPDPESAIRVFNGLRARLPLLQGLAANSPWWFGRDSGMASARSALVRSYPGRGVPPAFSGFDEYAERLAATAAGGGPEDYTLLWWDVRPHPRLGTVEVREMDVQSRLDDVAALAALVRALARREADRGPHPAVPADALAWSAFRAARDGLQARVLHDGSLVSLLEAAAAAVEEARPYAREAGEEEALAGIERLVREGAGADRQRAAHERGGMTGLLDHLVAETGDQA